MKDRLKILDCNRKAILSLPSPALHLWLTYYMNEDEDNESFMSVAEIERQIEKRMGRRTILYWTAWLVARGWLVGTGKTAADKFIEQGKLPTRGAYQINVYRVDDPTSAKSAPEKNPSLLEKQVSSTTGCTGADFALVQPVAHKVSGSCFDSVSGYGSFYHSRSTSMMAATPLSTEEREAEERTGKPENLKPEKPTVVLQQVKTGKPPKQAPDGTPYPEGFNGWTNAKRLEWLMLHGLKGRVNSKGEPMLVGMAELGDESPAEKQRLGIVPKPKPNAGQIAEAVAAVMAADPAKPWGKCIVCKTKTTRSPSSDYCEECWRQKSSSKEKLRIS